MERKIRKFLIGGPKYIEGSNEHTHTKMLGSTDKEEGIRIDGLRTPDKNLYWYFVGTLKVGTLYLTNVLYN